MDRQEALRLAAKHHVSEVESVAGSYTTLAKKAEKLEVIVSTVKSAIEKSLGPDAIITVELVGHGSENFSGKAILELLDIELDRTYEKAQRYQRALDAMYSALNDEFMNRPTAAIDPEKPTTIETKSGTVDLGMKKALK